MKRILIFTSIIIYFINTIKAQDPSFSEFFLNSPYLNPAVAGSANDPRIFLHYRNQWPQFGSAFITYQGSYDKYSKFIHGGYGFNILNDELAGGVLTTTNIDFIYSYRLKFTRNFTMQYGLQGSFQFYNTNPGSFNSTNQNSSTQPEPLDSRQTTQPDFAVGFLGMTRNSQVGFSLFHLNTGLIRFNYNYIKSPIKFTLFYTTNIKVINENNIQDEGFVVSPAIMVYKQSQSIMVNYGAGITKWNVFTGVWLRNNLPFQFTSIIFSLGYTFNRIRVGYSYDFELPSINNMMPATGAHEISLVMILPIDPRNERYGPVRCPKNIEVK